MKRLYPLTAILFLLLPQLACAATGNRLFSGAIEFVTLSGSGCGTEIKPGDRIPIELVLRVATGDQGENYDGYYHGPTIMTGHFAGENSAKLSLSYAGGNPVSQQEHVISLSLVGDKPAGEIREKHLDAAAKGCNFDLARLTLAAVAVGAKADTALTRLANRFAAEAASELATQQYEQGNLPEAIKHFDAVVNHLEQIGGASSEELVEPLLMQSIAYCALDRCAEGKRIQDRVFAIPPDESRRKESRLSIMQILFAEQAMRLARESHPEKGIALIEKAISFYPELTAFYAYLAAIALQDDDAPEACRLVEQAWGEHKNDVNLQEAQALCLVGKGSELQDADNMEASIELFENAWKLKPDNLNILAALQGAYIENGTPAKAHELLLQNAERMIKEFGQKEYNAVRALIYAAESNLAVKNRDYPLAETKIRTAMELDPENRSYALVLAGVVHKAGRFPEALGILEERLKKCPDAACREQTEQAVERERWLEIFFRKLKD